MNLFWTALIISAVTAFAVAAMLLVRRFAVALFFAGISTKLTVPGLRKAMLAVGCLVFLGTAVWIATSPITVAI